MVLITSTLGGDPEVFHDYFDDNIRVKIPLSFYHKYIFQEVDIPQFVATQGCLANRRLLINKVKFNLDQLHPLLFGCHS